MSSSYALGIQRMLMSQTSDLAQLSNVSETNIGPDIIHTRLNYMRLDISNMLDSKNIWLDNYVCVVGCSNHRVP